MATLNVTNLQNTAATVTNVSLLADGTTTLVLNATGTSRTGGIRYNASTLELYDGASWVVVGGGGGGVSSVTGTLPIVSTGGANPFLSINAATPTTAGSMSAADKAKLDGAATIVSSVTGTLPITVATGTSTPVIAINAATTAAAGSAQLADDTASKAGTSATLVSTPAFSVPKDASGMTGAALIPTGTQLQRPTPVAGMLRLNTTSGFFEGYQPSSSSWKELDYVFRPTVLPAPLNITANTTLSDGYYVCSDLTIAAGVTVTVGSQNIVIECFGNATILGSIVADFAGAAGASSYSANQYFARGGLGQGGAAGQDVSNNYTASANLVGSGGGVGNGESNGSGLFTGSGGAGGGGIAIKATGDIICSGSLSAQGANAVSPVPLFGATVYWASGNGGGSGGIIILDADGSINFSGTADVRGGNGTNAIRGGSAIGPRGGGGGGGGIIILQAGSVLTDTGTKNVTKGVKGNGLAPDNYGSGAGGSSGGKGSTGAGGGGDGLILTSGSPL